MSIPAAFVVLISASLALATTAAADSAVSDSVQQRVDEATFIILPERCTGVIVGDRHSGVTAAHCIGDEREIEVGLHDGTQLLARVDRVDRGRDVALLGFADGVAVRPLTLAARMPVPGEALYFGGRADRRGSNQVFAVVRVGSCPSMPQVSDAIFTNLRARKGDSGAPLVNKSLEVVGLVHGGATCNIAAPVVGMSEALGLSVGRDERCAWGHC